jgi:hypothetical protein
MYKISVYVPSEHGEAVKLAMFDQGGGRLRRTCFFNSSIGKFL